MLQKTNLIGFWTNTKSIYTLSINSRPDVFQKIKDCALSYRKTQGPVAEAR